MISIMNQFERKRQELRNRILLIENEGNQEVENDPNIEILERFPNGVYKTIKRKDTGSISKQWNEHKYENVLECPCFGCMCKYEGYFNIISDINDLEREYINSQNTQA